MLFKCFLKLIVDNFISLSIQLQNCVLVFVISLGNKLILCELKIILCLCFVGLYIFVYDISFMICVGHMLIFRAQNLKALITRFNSREKICRNHLFDIT